MSWGGVAFAACGSLAAALAAGLLPAWSAMRTSPLEAMVPLAAPSSRKTPWLAALAGLALIAIDPLLVFPPWMRWLESAGFEQADQLARSFQVYSHFTIALPCL